jgi:membrane-bound metal-dependent hydrolase YbcI (DUF457 family)
VVAGHFGLAAAVKARQPRVPTWSLMLASQWLDVLFVPLLVARVEGLSPVPGLKEGYGRVIIHADYTHSLLGALVLSALLGLVLGVRWGRQSGLVLAAVSFSHWVLDLLTHRQDLAILPGNAGHLPRLGFGLWRWPVASAAAELILVVVGSLM